MSCRQKYSDEIRQSILDSYGVYKTSATLLKPNKILLPLTDNHKTKEDTLEWAKRVQKEVNIKYNSKLFGNLIEIDNNTNPNGTIVDITIPTRLIDAYERKYGTQTEMFQLSADKKLVNKINKGLKEYIKNNNIKIEFLEDLQNKYDPVSIFNIIKNTIKINQNKADITTLPEELSHHITIAMEDSVLVNRAINLTKKLGIENILEDEYEQYKVVYNGNKDLLAKEALGKLISKSLITKLSQPNELKSEIGNKLWETIKRLLNKFIELFTPNNNIITELQKDVDSLASLIIEGKKTNIKNPLFNGEMYQLNKNYKPTNNIKKQYAYYKAVIIKNQKLISKYKRAILEDPKVDKKIIQGNIEYLKEQITKITKALDELEVSNNKQLIIDLAEDTLKYAEDYIKKLNDLETTTINDENINHIKYTVDVLKEFAPTAKRAIDLYNNGLQPLIKKYALYIASEAENRTVDNPIIQEDIDKDIKDIFVGEKSLGTLSDVKDTLGKSIGYLIKEAQNKIALENKEAFKLVDVEVKKLSKYIESKELNPKDTYNIFIQEGNGATVLTRPYKSEFYKEINKTYKDEKNGKILRRKIATWNAEEEKWIPKNINLYKNLNYYEIQNTPELKRFYDFFKEQIEKASDKLPISLNEDFIPNIVEETLLDIIKSDKDVQSKFKDSISYITDIYDIKDNTNDFIFDEGLYPDTVPLQYIAKLSSNKKSTDLGSSLLKFIYFANSYDHMSDVLPKTKLILDEIKNKQYLKYTDNKVSISGENTNIYKMAEKFIEMQVLGKTKNEEIWQGIQYGKIIDFGLKYTSILRIGFNPFNASTNIIIGRISNIIEAWGNRYFTLKQYHQAEKIFFSEVLKSNSKMLKIVELINPLMELEDYENLEKVGIAYTKTEKYKEKLKNSIYILQTSGEKYLQTTTMIANMLHDTITSIDGKTIVPIWEAFDEAGKWKTKEFGELTEVNIFRMSNKIQRINQSIHGRYSEKDSAIMNQYALFRIFFQFKKWMPAAFESRLQSKRYDSRLEKEIEGRWLTYYTAIKTKHLQLTYNLEKMEKNGWTETDVYNMRRNIAELVIIITTVLTSFVLGGAGDDDKKLKKTGWYKFIMSQLNQVSGDLLYFFNPADMNRTFTEGFPLFKTIHDLFKAIIVFPHIFGMQGKKDIYKSGPRKGENKSIAAFKDIIPGIKPATDVYRMFAHDNPYKAPTNR